MSEAATAHGRWKVAAPLALASIALAVVAAVGVGSLRWRHARVAIREQLEARHLPSPVATFCASELVGLPAPVQRYFEAVLRPGQPIVTAASLSQSGTIDLSGTGTGWKSFTADQRVVTRLPGFDWDASIKAFAGGTVRVRDAYLDGEGILVASMWGLVPLANSCGAAETARAELMRFLAEAAWYPTALLPSQGVRWAEVDAMSATATFADGALEVTMRFAFDDAGLIGSVRSEARAAMVGGEIVMTPWEGSFSNYREQHGMVVPFSGEAAWLTNEGREPYWRGAVGELEYEFAESA